MIVLASAVGVAIGWSTDGRLSGHALRMIVGVIGLLCCFKSGSAEAHLGPKARRRLD